ncbi:hypothetical protein F5B22DRAFT_643496 [Xylaria bambusicola]|uniref:uncharacterized protein n=1 Tax=Xylaria bambusicola TaxID=326684 RepID=UPI002007837D|nr:uncharacterized protein F5B22DRAFT_643496 [Xylaria bambusicola]KAI0521914.1 hypothetical protein F5B22DRAFT_643496 [Xylaria bambusicola]
MSDTKVFNDQLTARRHEAVIYTLALTFNVDLKNIEKDLQELEEEFQVNIQKVCEKAFSRRIISLSVDAINWKAEQYLWKDRVKRAGKSLEDYPFCQREYKMDSVKSQIYAQYRRAAKEEEKKKAEEQKKKAEAAQAQPSSSPSQSTDAAVELPLRDKASKPEGESERVALGPDDIRLLHDEDEEEPMLMMRDLANIWPRQLRWQFTKDGRKVTMNLQTIAVAVQLMRCMFAHSWGKDPSGAKKTSPLARMAWVVEPFSERQRLEQSMSCCKILDTRSKTNELVKLNNHTSIQSQMTKFFNRIRPFPPPHKGTIQLSCTYPPYIRVHYQADKDDVRKDFSEFRSFKLRQEAVPKICETEESAKELEHLPTCIEEKEYIYALLACYFNPDKTNPSGELRMWSNHEVPVLPVMKACAPKDLFSQQTQRSMGDPGVNTIRIRLDFLERVMTWSADSKAARQQKRVSGMASGSESNFSFPQRSEPPSNPTPQASKLPERPLRMPRTVDGNLSKIDPKESYGRVQPSCNNIKEEQYDDDDDEAEFKRSYPVSPSREHGRRPLRSQEECYEAFRRSQGQRGRNHGEPWYERRDRDNRDHGG